MAKQQTVTDPPPPNFKVIAEQIASLLLVAKECGAEQETVRQALQAFSSAARAAATDRPPF